MRTLSLLAVLTLALQVEGKPLELVIYNSGFAVVRDTVPLDLQAGENAVHYRKVTEQIDPGSVILRDPTGQTSLRILEQKFRAEALKQETMIELFEGQSIPFRVFDAAGVKEVVGKIVRANVAERYGGRSGPIVEVDGKYMFELPGSPLFPKLPEGAQMQPELAWVIAADKPAKLEAELVFTTGGLDWSADYNAVVTESGDVAELTGWITIKNTTARTFPEAEVKVVAGDVNKVDRETAGEATTERVVVTGSYIPTPENESALPEVVQRKSFDEYHEYTLQRPATLKEKDITQVQFVRATGVEATRSFVYNGGAASEGERSSAEAANLNPLFGAGSNSRITILTEFKNDAANKMGMPLPRGRFHFYRDENSRLQFTGESMVRDTPADEMVRAVSGNAFDLVGERRQVDFRVSDDGKAAEETFEIKLRNHRKEAVEIRAVEQAARWREWEITRKSSDFKKIDARTLEFLVPVPAGGEKIMSYSIRYNHLPRRRE